MHKAITSLLCIVLWIVLTPAEAGHELPYYPSFYPHEIHIEVVAPEVAATRLQQGTLHAYVSAIPHFAAPPPAYVGRPGADRTGWREDDSACEPARPRAPSRPA